LIETSLNKALRDSAVQQFGLASDIPIAAGNSQ
jgi:hypothetical protein